MSESEKSYRFEFDGIVFEGKDDGIHDPNLGENPGPEGPAGTLDSPFAAGFVASLPRDVLGDGERDIYLVKEVRYAGCTEYNLFMHPNGDKNFALCIGGFPGLEELKKLGEMFKKDLESGRELSETFRDGARQIIAAIEAVEK